MKISTPPRFFVYRFMFYILTPRKTTLPGVCSPVEAGEVARTACRRGGDLPRGIRQKAQNDACIEFVIANEVKHP